MKRRFNYTGRERIKRERISLSVIRENETITSFILNRLDLDGLTLPEDARVYAEAYYRTELKRFDCGTSCSPRIPLTGDLRDLAYPQNLKFRILVVDTADGKILACADRFSPEAPAEKKSILPVEFRDLGNEVWRVDYEGEGGAPILCINIRIPNIQNIAKTDSQFFVHVYPAVLREILMHVVFVEGIDSVSDPEADWHADWLKFCRYLSVNPPDSLDPGNDNFDKYVATEWINNVVEASCNQYTDRFQEYIGKLEEIQ